MLAPNIEQTGTLRVNVDQMLFAQIKKASFSQCAQVSSLFDDFCRTEKLHPIDARSVPSYQW